jgi:hypothetical protein
MRFACLTLTFFSLVACAAGVPHGYEPAELYDLTPDGGRVSNADGNNIEAAPALAKAHCAKTGREMRVVNERVLLIDTPRSRTTLVFLCVAPA